MQSKDHMARLPGCWTGYWTGYKVPSWPVPSYVCPYNSGNTSALCAKLCGKRLLLLCALRGRFSLFFDKNWLSYSPLKLAAGKGILAWTRNLDLKTGQLFRDSNNWARMVWGIVWRLARPGRERTSIDEDTLIQSGLLLFGSGSTVAFQTTPAIDKWGRVI